MADLIERAALLEKRVPKEKTSDLVCQMIPLKDVLEAPAVDAVEVVRCKDCRYFSESGERPELFGFCNLYPLALSRLSDGFCNFGERKET